MKKKSNVERKSPRPKKAASGALAVGAGYAVRFRKQVHGCFACMSSLDVMLERTVVIPIPPFIGLEVSDGDWTAIIEAVYIPLKRGTIEAHMPADKEIYNAQLHKQEHRPLAEIVKEYTAAGWTISA